jgi:hypothetical protein
MVREVYTAQFEDLASHGYVVAAISHPTLSTYVGLAILSEELRRPMRASSTGVSRHA